MGGLEPELLALQEYEVGVLRCLSLQHSHYAAALN